MGLRKDGYSLLFLLPVRRMGSPTGRGRRLLAGGRGPLEDGKTSHDRWRKTASRVVGLVLVEQGACTLAFASRLDQKQALLDVERVREARGGGVKRSG